jgi:cell division protein FtsI (penicillin-binding protein 3)
VRIAALLAWDRARTPLGRARLLALGFTAAALLMVVACATPSSYVASGAASPATALAAAPALASRAPASIAASPEGALATKREGMPADAIARAAAGERGGARAELTLDPALQEIAEDETDHLVAEWKTRAANVIVIDPATGAILAMTSRSPDATREVAVATEYVPGSTLKSLVVAAALEERTVEEHQRFFCENGQRAYGKRTLHDAAPHGWLETSEVLAVSSNVGAAKISETLGAARLDTWLKRFHLGQRPPVQIASAASGAIPAPSDDAFASAVLSIGEGLTATPLQIASGYAALANDGIYNAPTLVRRVFDGDGRVVWEHRPTAERLLRADTAHAVMTMLERVVTSDKGTGRAAHVEGHRVAGKTGTADLPRPAGAPAPKEGEEEYYASFVGAVPADHPRYVILVGAEASRAHGYGGTVAAPVFARIATRALAR